MMLPTYMDTVWTDSVNCESSEQVHYMPDTAKSVPWIKKPIGLDADERQPVSVDSSKIDDRHRQRHLKSQCHCH